MTTETDVTTQADVTTGPGARERIDELAVKGDGRSCPDEDIGSPRVILRTSPRRRYAGCH